MLILLFFVQWLILSCYTDQYWILKTGPSWLYWYPMQFILGFLPNPFCYDRKKFSTHMAMSKHIRVMTHDQGRKRGKEEERKRGRSQRRRTYQTVTTVTGKLKIRNQSTMKCLSHIERRYLCGRCQAAFSRTFVCSLQLSGPQRQRVSCITLDTSFRARTRWQSTNSKQSWALLSITPLETWVSQMLNSNSG